MPSIRLIARLDIKGPDLIKGVQLEGWRKIGDPAAFARRYYEDGADELIYMDVVASLYERNNLTDIVERTAREVFVSLCVGGGIRSVDDVSRLLRVGADKVAVNTAATRRPELITELAERFGSQCIVLGIEAKRLASGAWEAYTDNGREKTGLDVVEWAARGAALGAGEIFLTSVDRDGTCKGFDDELIRAVSGRVSLPVIAGGGLGSADDLCRVVADTGVGAVAIGRALHTNRVSFPSLREEGQRAGLPLRTP